MTWRITVFGIVQGVGYRPFVARMAEEMSVEGTVLNSGGIVQIVASAPDEAILKRFAARLTSDQPMGAKVVGTRTETLPDQYFDGFQIIPSTRAIQAEAGVEDFMPDHPLIPADLPLCADCLEELYDPDNRRYLYPFISCVACGPRYSIIKGLPYDRETVTMDVFPMCPACGTEYTENQNRRRHAQTISCHDCGPQLILERGGRIIRNHDALTTSIGLLKSGAVLAIKGIGGYQLACLPTDEKAVYNLRMLKKRDKKPFAVMFPTLESIRAYCTVNDEEAKLLQSAARPIVLLNKRNSFCAGVGDESRFTGAFLPYTPLHQLLTDACGPLIMTSANQTSNPILYRDEDMRLVRSPFLTGILYNERRITTPLDDSVARVVSTGNPQSENRLKPQLVRRSRGYVPLPVILNQPAQKAILAMGGDLKASFCLYHNNRAYISQYFGDMENHLVSAAYRENIGRMETLFDITPDIIVCDMHPGYFTTLLAEELLRGDPSSSQLPVRRKKTEFFTVQHHHAHAASVMAEHDLSSCIAVVFDGTGYGTDGAIWGGEFLLCSGRTFTRRAHLGYVPLCGGDAAARNAGLAAQCYLAASDPVPKQAGVGGIAGSDTEDSRMATVRAAIENGVNTRKSSSMGRLFDAVSAILGIRQENTFEAECAIALENAAARYKKKIEEDKKAKQKTRNVDCDPDNTCQNRQNGVEWESIRFAVGFDPEETIVDQVGLFAAIYARMVEFTTKRKGVEETEAFRETLAYAFHRAAALMVRDVCIHLRKESGENKVVLSGGVFANLLLLEDCIRLLEENGFRVYTNSEVPSNDGGICLGQAWLARM